jgi:hypothetical protein
MGPVVQKLEKDYSGRIEVRQYYVNQITQSSPEFPALAKLADAIHFQVTPTFLVVSKNGQVHGRYEGVTSYASLSRDLEAELAVR